jgi:hypothetical protein
VHIPVLNIFFFIINDEKSNQDIKVINNLKTEPIRFIIFANEKSKIS